MIEKIKAWGLKIGAILAPLLGMLAYIFFLRQENTQLKDSIAVEKAKEELGKVLDEKQKQAEVASADELSYTDIRDAYIRADTELHAGNPSGGQSASSEGQGDSTGKPSPAAVTGYEHDADQEGH